MIISGPFKDKTVEISSIVEEKETLTVLIEVFGRYTPTEVSLFIISSYPLKIFSAFFILIKSSDITPAQISAKPHLKSCDIHSPFVICDLLIYIVSFS